MKIVSMKKDGKVVAYGRNEDEDCAKNDAIRDYYINGDHDLTHDELWDMIEDGEFDFETKSD
jgi:hypothetical protein